MKMKKTIILTTIAFGLFACGSSNQSEAENTVAETVEETVAVNYSVDTENSITSWKGSMVAVYAHTGDLKFSDGSLTINGGMVTAGDFSVDMTSMVTTDDDALYEMAPREKLIGHLQAPDFFATEEFPTASFTINSAEGDMVTGDLTVKGVTKEATINSVVITETEGSVTATGSLVFNRQDYGITYTNTMNDMVLSDDIELTINITGQTK